MGIVFIEEIESDRKVDNQSTNKRLCSVFELHSNERKWFEDDDYLNLFKCLSSLLEGKKQIDELTNKFEMLNTMVSAMATGDFSCRIDLPGANTMYASIGTLLNTLAAKLENVVVKKSYLYESIELISDAILVTDNNGVIMLANTKAAKLLNRSLEDTLFLQIANVFVIRREYEATSSCWETKVDMKFVQPYNQDPVSVEVTANEIMDSRHGKEGMIYLLKLANFDKYTASDSI